MAAVLGQERSLDSGFTESYLAGADTSESSNVLLSSALHSKPSGLLDSVNNTAEALYTPPRGLQELPAERVRRMKIASKRSSTSPLPRRPIDSINPSRWSSAISASAVTVPERWHSSRRSSSRRTSRSYAEIQIDPVALRRGSSAFSVNAKLEDLYVLHRRARQVFASSSETSQSTSKECEQPLISNNNSLQCSLHAPAIETLYNASDEKPKHETSYTPCTIIDWTAPDTRRREYEKIDKSTRGLRGLWRRVAPQWCRSSGRISFYEDDEDDDGSVRRYRVEIPAEEGGKQEQVRFEEHEISLPRVLRSRTWCCFSSRCSNEAVLAPHKTALSEDFNTA